MSASPEAVMEVVLFFLSSVYEEKVLSVWMLMSAAHNRKQICLQVYPYTKRCTTTVEKKEDSVA